MMDMMEAIMALEQTGYDYTIHKMEYGYECLIAPEYAYCMELVSAKTQACGKVLSLVIYAALNNLHAVQENDENAHRF